MSRKGRIVTGSWDLEAARSLDDRLLQALPLYSASPCICRGLDSVLECETVWIRLGPEWRSEEGRRTATTSSLSVYL